MCRRLPLCRDQQYTAPLPQAYLSRTDEFREKIGRLSLQLTGLNQNHNVLDPHQASKCPLTIRLCLSFSAQREPPMSVERASLSRLRMQVKPKTTSGELHA